jgi:prevent-host-death family protein
MSKLVHKGAEEARNQLPGLLEAAEKGRSTIITRRGRAVAALVPMESFQGGGRQQSLLELAGSGDRFWSYEQSPREPQCEGQLSLAELPAHALLLLDSPPLITFLQGRPATSSLRPVFEAHARGQLRFGVTTIAIADVLAGPIAAADEHLTARYRAIFESWLVVDLSTDIAERAARLRAALQLTQPDSVLVASAIAVNAGALVTFNSELARICSLRVLP